jgi:heme exporter protein D
MAEYAFLIWSFVTVALAAFAIFIVARSSYRARV